MGGLTTGLFGVAVSAMIGSGGAGFAGSGTSIIRSGTKGGACGTTGFGSGTVSGVSFGVSSGFAGTATFGKDKTGGAIIGAVGTPTGC